jgi:hypothetical protein
MERILDMLELNGGGASKAHKKVVSRTFTPEKGSKANGVNHKTCPQNHIF